MAEYGRILDRVSPKVKTMSNEQQQQLDKELALIAATKNLLKMYNLADPDKEDQVIINRIVKDAQLAYTAYYSHFGTTIFTPGSMPEPRVIGVNSVASIRDLFGGFYATDLQHGPLSALIRKQGEKTSR